MKNKQTQTNTMTLLGPGARHFNPQAIGALLQTVSGYNSICPLKLLQRTSSIVLFPNTIQLVIVKSNLIIHLDQEDTISQKIVKIKFPLSVLHLYNFVHSLHNSPSQLLSGAHNVLPNPLYYKTEQQQQSIYIVEVFNWVLKKKTKTKVVRATNQTKG